jgi:3'-phosphoadenosine 5'-phosphosulfate sulfotransferase (PAPS reductase)/FAD synthetase
MTERNLLWVDGVNSAVMAHFVLKEIPDATIMHCDLGDSVHEDSRRFIDDLEGWYGREIIRIRSEKYANIDEVFEHRKYLAGTDGAPCTGEMKFVPRMNFERPWDTHFWGYAADPRDAKRFKLMRKNYPLLKQRSPLIEMGMMKRDTHAYLAECGIRRPYVYEIGMPNGNCLCCVKASSPNYWAHQRKHFPEVFARRAAQCRKWGARLTRIKGVRIFIDEIPLDWPTEIKDNFGGCGFHCATEDVPQKVWLDL